MYIILKNHSRFPFKIVTVFFYLVTALGAGLRKSAKNDYKGSRNIKVINSLTVS